MATTPIYGLTEPTVGGNSGAWGGLLNADLATLDTLISLPRIAAAGATVGATTTIDLTVANIQTVNLTQNTTIAFSNVPAGAFSSRVTLLVFTNTYTIAWPVSVTWPWGAPTFGAGGTYLIDLVTTNNGTTWYGFVAWGGQGSVGVIPKRQCLLSLETGYLNQAGGTPIVLQWQGSASDYGLSVLANNQRMLIPSGWEGGSIALTLGAIVTGCTVANGYTDLLLSITKNGTLVAELDVPASAAAAISGTVHYLDTAPVATNYYSATVLANGAVGNNISITGPGPTAGIFFSGQQIY